MKNNFQIALEKVIEKEASAYEQGGEHTFSPDFEKEMNALVKKSGKNTHFKKGKIGIIILAAAVAILTLGAGAMAQSTGFVISSDKPDTIYRVPMRYFTYEDTGDSPKTLETFYTLSGLGDEYTRTLRLGGDTSLGTYYLRGEKGYKDNMFTYKDMVLCQEVKSSFKTRFIEAKYSHFEEFSYNGRTAYYAYYERFYGRNAMLVWENGEYCFSLEGNFTKEEAVELADSLKPCEKEIVLNEIVEETP